MISIHKSYSIKQILSRFISTILVLCLSFLMSVTVNSQEEQKLNTTVSYTDDYFVSYPVVTLADMVRLIPGGITILNSLDDNQQSRGLGSTGAQILIDGKRMSGKANDMETRLSRIQANQVERIDLIRGTAEGLDIRSQGVLINVILKSDAIDKTIYLSELGLNHNNQQSFKPELLINASGRYKQLQYDIGVNHDIFIRTTDFTEDRMTPSRALEEVRTINREFLWKANSVNTNLEYTFDDGDVLRFNGLYRDVTRDEENFEDQFDFASGNLLAKETLFVMRDDKTWELGGDYETKLDGIGTLKTIFVVNTESNKDNIVQDAITDTGTVRLFTFAEDSEEIEQIIRTNLSTKIFDKQNLDVGFEAAFNELDALQSFDSSPFESSNIKEDRYEFFGTYSTDISGSVHLQASIIREESTIKQDAIGIVNQRSFGFWKPRIELRYDLDANKQLRFIADRSVSQLNLRNFIATRNTENDTIDFGNPDLVPQKVWQYLIAYEHRFADDAGTIGIELFKDEIADFITNTRNADGSSGIGNIGDAKRLGLDVEASGTLDFLGLKSARVSFTYRLRDTEMIDPFLNIERRLNGVASETYLLDFRHDLKDLGIVYGFDVNKRSYRFLQNRTVSEIRTNIIDIDDFYVEYSINKQTRLRFQIARPLKDRENYDRIFYAGDIADGVVDRIELRKRNIRPTYILKLQSTF